ncbi:hypothetical protein [Pedobacter changchengzhani]|uniref:hypothetical protein n=1 Tax=Pedobacter changchengzhani TaxID=2529274 RepID=UPI0014044AE2|nr:hypothetical protein [Pedobacter changchengzhani]
MNINSPWLKPRNYLDAKQALAKNHDLHDAKSSFSFSLRLFLFVYFSPLLTSH